MNFKVKTFNRQPTPTPTTITAASVSNSSIDRSSAAHNQHARVKLNEKVGNVDASLADKHLRNKPSKIPKYNKANAKCGPMIRRDEKENQPKCKQTPFLTRIPQRQLHKVNQPASKQQQQNLILHSSKQQQQPPLQSTSSLKVTAAIKTSNSSHAANYRTYTKKTPSKTSNISTTTSSGKALRCSTTTAAASITPQHDKPASELAKLDSDKKSNPPNTRLINSATFDKLPTVSSPQPLQIDNQLSISVKLPVQTAAIEIENLSPTKSNHISDKRIMRIKDDEGYSTMSSELMHNQVANACSLSSRSATSSSSSGSDHNR
jgi:hypothetical protein